MSISCIFFGLYIESKSAHTKESLIAWLRYMALLGGTPIIGGMLEGRKTARDILGGWSLE